jgi:hypothetical protein
MHKGFMTALAAGAAALTLSLGTTAAMAGQNTGWTVAPGGAATGKGPAQVKDTSTGTIAKCTALTMKVTLKKTATGGAKLGKITAGTFTGCTIGPISVTVTASAFPWYLNATSYASGVTHGNITGIHLVATATDCSATLDGTSGTADNGKVLATYTNSTHKLALLASGGNLHDWDVSGCLGLENNGDPQDASGTLTVTPAQTITGP